MNVFIPNNAIVCIDAMSPRKAFMFENMFATYAKSFFSVTLEFLNVFTWGHNLLAILHISE